MGGLERRGLEIVEAFNSPTLSEDLILMWPDATQSKVILETWARASRAALSREQELFLLRPRARRSSWRGSRVFEAV